MEEASMKICDLHTHSTCSDGSDSPEELLDNAIKAGLSAVAITDHNNVEGIVRFQEAAKNKNIEAVGGCEFSTDYEGKELHLVGLFLKEEKLPIIRKFLEQLAIDKIQSNYDTIQRFKDAGYDVDVEEFKKTLTAVVPNRVHIANYLVSKGICVDRNDAFDHYLKDGGKFYRSPKKPDFIGTIDFIHSVGGVAVWAHPLFHVDEEQCLEVLTLAKKLDGVECYYTTYTDEQTKFMLEKAKEFNLIASGGSDYHGTNKVDVNLGTGHGNLVVPFSCFEELKKRATK